MQQAPIELGESTGKDIEDDTEDQGDTMQEGMGEHDRTGASMANDDPRSAPESGDKNP